MSSIRSVIVAAAFACLPTMALAGDIAAFHAIGFSADGRYFGFEQSGIQDGAGFPYSEIVIVDLKNDAFAGGTPIKRMIEDEAATLVQVRKQTHDAAKPAIDKLGIDADPGIVLAYNGPAEIIDDATKLAFSPYAMIPAPPTIYRLALETKELKPADKCFQGDPNYGFTLTIQKDGDTEKTTLHDDDRIPASRGCPSSYSILGVISNHDYMNKVAVAIIQVNTYGFEGSDGRYIAIPLPSLAQ